MNQLSRAELLAVYYNLQASYSGHMCDYARMHEHLFMWMCYGGGTSWTPQASQHYTRLYEQWRDSRYSHQVMTETLKSLHSAIIRFPVPTDTQQRTAAAYARFERMRVYVQEDVREFNWTTDREKLAGLNAAIDFLGLENDTN